ncbi:MAG TPA: YoaK family protein [Candidatus Aquilonibacter sp.]
MGTKPLALLLLLTVIAGYADAIVFVGLHNIFVANMTGNVVLLGVGLVGMIHHLPGAVDAGMPMLALAAFACGVAAVVAFARKGQRKRAIVLVSEAVLSAAAAALWMHPPAAIALLSLAMGAQSAAASQIGLAGISTTYVTGTLVTGILRALRPRPGDDRLDARSDFTALGCYLAGAALGAGAFVLCHGNALWPASLALAVLGALAYS